MWWYVTGNVLQAHGQGEHGEPGSGGRAEHRRSVRRGRTADDGHVQERGQTLGHDGSPELQRAEFGLEGHQLRPGVGPPPPGAGTHRPPVPLQPLDQLQHHVEMMVQLGAVIFALHGDGDYGDPGTTYVISRSGCLTVLVFIINVFFEIIYYTYCCIRTRRLRDTILYFINFWSSSAVCLRARATQRTDD